MKAHAWTGRMLPPLAPLVILFGTMELVVRAGWVKSFLMPTPTSIFAALFQDGAGSRELWLALLQTTLGSLAGFALSASIGLVAAILLGSASWVRRAFYPYAVFFQTVPIIAIAPLLVIWVGFGIKTVIVTAFIVSVFPVIANTLTGLASVDPALRDLFKLYRAGPFATLFRLKLPYALPAIFTGLRISAGLAVIGAIVGEFITDGGLGGVIQVARQQQSVERVFACLLLSAFLGVAMFSLISMMSRLTLRHWHASESAG